MLQLVELSGLPDDIRQVQQVLDDSPRYHVLTSGQPAKSTAGGDMFTPYDLPPGTSVTARSTLGIMQANQMVGVVDMLRGFPNPSTVHIGLVMLSEKYQGKGLGRATLAAIQRYVSQWPDIHTLRISVVDTNREVLAFWQKMGFTLTGETRPYQEGTVTSFVHILAKPL